MNSSLPTEDTNPGLGRTLCVVFQHSANSLTSIRLRPDVPLEMASILLGDHTGVPSAAPRHITGPVSEVATPEEPVDLQSRTFRGQPDAITGNDDVRSLGPLLRSSNNFINAEADSSGPARRPPADGDRDFNEAPLIRSKLSKSLMAALTVGALSLVAVPGLVLGVVTKQIPWGIALSGAIATVVSFFAGLYYYHNK